MKVQICNFRCFRQESTFNFENGRLTLLKGQSGAGKSTLLEGIRWCLFGNVRSIYPAGFTPSGSNKTYVSIELNNINITRSQAPEQLKVVTFNRGTTFNQGTDSVLTQESAQAYIDSVFGNRNVWLASSFIRQGEKCPLMTATNTERMTLLNEILFGSDFTTNFENPDYYIERIDKELDVLDADINAKTAVFNSYYGKYVEAIKGFTNPYGWKEMNTDFVKNITGTIEQFKVGIENLRVQLLEISKLETRKKMLAEKLATFSSISLSEPMDLAVPNLKLKAEALQGKLLSMKMELQKAVSDYTRFGSLNDSLTIAKEKLTTLSVPDMSTEQLSMMLASLKAELLFTQSAENERVLLNQQLTSLEIDLKSLKEKYTDLTEFCGSDSIETIQEILLNSEIYSKIQEMNKNIVSLHSTIDFTTRSDVDVSELNRQLNTSRYNDSIYKKYSLAPGFESREATLTLTKSKLAFHEEQVVHLANHSQRIQLQNQLTNLKSMLATPAGICIPEFEIDENVRRIEARLGSPLKCPCCNTTLEMKDNVLVIPSSELISREEGMKQIEYWRKLKSDCLYNRNIESQIETLTARLNAIPETDAKYLAQPPLKPEEVAHYKTMIVECEGVQPLSHSTSQLETMLSNSLKLQEYNDLVKRYTDMTKAFKNTVPVKAEFYKLKEAIDTLPSLKSKINFSESRITEIKTKLVDITERIKYTPEEFQRDITSTNEEYENAKLYEETRKLIQSIETEVSKISLRDTNLLEAEISSTESSLIQMKDRIKLVEEYMSVKSQYDSPELVIPTSSSTIQSLIEENQVKLDDLQLQKVQAEFMLTLLNNKSELETLQRELLDLTGKKGNLNSLKNIIIDVTNSALQELVDNINNTTNNILEDLFDVGIVIELKLYREMKAKKTVKPYVNFTIHHNGNTYDNVSHLSGGEQSRVSLALTIALSMIHTSPIIIFDEVLGTLDMNLRESCIEAMRKYLIEEGGKTVTDVEHIAVEGAYDEVIQLGCC